MNILPHKKSIARQKTAWYNSHKKEGGRMRKKGFTLAEVLITLTIVGVIAAIVLPGFISNAYNRTFASKLSTISADLENTFGMMMLKENANSIFDTEFGSAYSTTSPNTTTMTSALRKYMKVGQTATTTSDLGYLSYNFITPFLPAAIAEDGNGEEGGESNEPEWGDDDVCNDPSNPDYDESYCQNHCQTSQFEDVGPNGEPAVCVSCFAEYYDYDPELGKCVRKEGVEDFCRNIDDSRYNGLDCRKLRCQEDRGIFKEDSNGDYICINLPINNNNNPTPTGDGTPFYTINNDPVTSNDFSYIMGMGMANGGNIFMGAPKTFQTKDENGVVTDSRTVATIYVDVNGKDMPNKFGRDVFAFVLVDDGHLYPYGSENAAIALELSVANNANTWKSDNVTYGCTKKGFKGLGCTARLVENNFKVDY